jgi:hypothetical protein
LGRGQARIEKIFLPVAHNNPVYSGDIRFRHCGKLATSFDHTTRLLGALEIHRFERINLLKPDAQDHRTNPETRRWSRILENTDIAPHFPLDTLVTGR